MFILVIYIYAGFLAKGDSVTIDHIEGFKTQQECELAGDQLEDLVDGSTKEFEFKCIKN